MPLLLIQNNNINLHIGYDLQGTTECDLRCQHCEGQKKQAAVRPQNTSKLSMHTQQSFHVWVGLV